MPAPWASNGMVWNPRVGLVALLVIALSTAGCASKGGDAVDCSDPVHAADTACGAPTLSASATTGVIRGVVFDAAIKPVAGVKVTVPDNAAKKTLTAETTSNGQFSFQNLAAGTYFVTAKKAGYLVGQTSVEVKAGDANPPSTKIQLLADPATNPYSAAYEFDGYIECSGSFVAAGYAVCQQAGVLNDKFDAIYTLDRTPTWVQSEMVWDSTQAVSNELNLDYSYDDGHSALLANYVNVHGKSPVIGHADKTLAESVNLGNGTDLWIRVFNEPINGTRPSDPVNNDPCVDRPVLGGCATGLGVTVEQAFTVYTHVFYGYAPPAGWTFGTTNLVPPPK